MKRWDLRYIWPNLSHVDLEGEVADVGDALLLTPKRQHEAAVALPHDGRQAKAQHAEDLSRKDVTKRVAGQDVGQRLPGSCLPA